MAVTYAPWGFAEGEQVFENYGQPNHIYYMYHGFSLASGDTGGGYDRILEPRMGSVETAVENWDAEAHANTHDCVLVRLQMSQDAFMKLDSDRVAMLARQYYLRDPRSLDACVGVFEPIAARVWLYLAMMADDVDAFVEVVDSFDYDNAASAAAHPMGPMGTPATRSLLTTILESRLPGYEAYDFEAAPHASSAQLLRLEHQMIRSVLAMLRSYGG
jgi:hypothetical protein